MVRAMKAVVAMDSFKGSMSTEQAGFGVAQGIKRVFPDACITVVPMADGGEGSADVIIRANGGITRTVSVQNPLGRPIEARYGILPADKTAVMEMAAAAGITLIPEQERNPMHTSTFGVGEMIRDAIAQGCRRFLVGIGGSATNDGGIGMLSALGFAFLDEEGNSVPPGGEGLGKVRRISVENALPELEQCSFLVACDVQNPLCGELGCSAVYGPQKGADRQMVAEMDRGMAHFARCTRQFYPHADPERPGSGAAGGLGFAFCTYLNGTLRPGIDLMIQQTGLEEKIKQADIVITGEGRLDGQSCMGKTPVGVAAVAKKHGKPVLAFSGCVTEDAGSCNGLGIDAFFPIVKGPCTLEEAMAQPNAVRNLADTAEQAFRLIYTFGEKL